MGAEFFVVVTDIFGSLEWTLLHVTHTSGAPNFEVTHRFLEDSCTSDMQIWVCLVERGLTYRT